MSDIHTPETRALHGKRPYAFRCKECGHLHEAGCAGELEHPASCVVCGAGVSYHPRLGTKQLVKENWDILHEATDTWLKELGLNRSQVCKHTPTPKTPNPDPKQINVRVSETTASKDRV
jgi:hypothetical protein